MENKAEIVEKHEKRHKELEQLFYFDKEISKEEFDRLHGENWTGLERALIESGFLAEPKELRDLAAELDNLKERVSKLEPLFFPRPQ